MNDDTATVCRVCGVSLYAPSPVNAPVQAQQYAAPPAPGQQYTQPQAPGQPYQQPLVPGYTQPQDGYRQPQDGYRQPSAPVKKKIKPMTLMLIVAGAVALVVIIALLLIPRPRVDITDPPVSDTEDVTGDVVEEDVAEEKEEKKEEKKDEKEDEKKEENLAPGEDPPFLKTIRTGVYGYDMKIVDEMDGYVYNNKGFIYSNESYFVYALTENNGELRVRYVYDYKTKQTTNIADYSKSYSVTSQDIYNVVGLPDLRPGQNQTGSGTADLDKESLQYIDYGSGANSVRVFIKNGDMCAIQFHKDGCLTTFHLTKTYTSCPTSEYFEIPSDYEKRS